jgi:subtilisin family serine protease
MNHFILKIFGLTLLAGVVACNKPKVSGQWRNQSPIFKEDLGLIVSQIHSNQLSDLLKNNRIDARIISKKAEIYEIYGLSLSEAKEFFPNSEITENQFLPIESSLLKPGDSDNLAHSKRHLRIINAVGAWELSRGKKVKIAVIDTGFNFQHSELKSISITNEKDPINGLDDDGNGFVDDYMGWNFGDHNADLSDFAHHGTSVSSIIASPNAGVAPESKILSLKVANSAQVIDEASVIAALQYVLNEFPVDLINLSFGKASINPILRKTLRAFEEKRILISAGIGNNGLECDLIKVFPASFRIKNILKVGASVLDLDHIFQLASYSNFGTCVDILAPAGEQNDGILVPYYFENQSQHILFNGSSAATPIITGVAALIKSLHPEFNSDDLKAVILKSGTKDSKIKGFSKGGIINAALALKNANDYHPKE